MNCKSCGEHMSGDGYTLPYRCPNASEERWWYSAPDEGPYYCTLDEEEEE